MVFRGEFDSILISNTHVINLLLVMAFLDMVAPKGAVLLSSIGDGGSSAFFKMR